MDDGSTSTPNPRALADLSTIAHPTASPTGDEIALYYDGTGRNELHVCDVDGGDLTQWSDGEVPRDAGSTLRWAPDGDRVLFHRDTDGDEQYDVYAIGPDGAVDPVVTSTGRNTLHDVDPDGTFVVVGSTRDGQLDLYRHELGGSGTTRLTDADRPVWWSVLSPTADRIAYVTGDLGDVDVYVADVDGSGSRKLPLGGDGAEAMVADWSPDGTRLLVGDDTAGRTRVGAYDLATDEPTWFGDGAYEESPKAFLSRGDRALATRDRDAMTVPVVYDVETGDGREFDLPDGVGLFGTVPRPPKNVLNRAVLDERRVLLTHATPTTRPSLLVYDYSTHERETLVAADHGPFEPADFADAAYLTFESDGVPPSPSRRGSSDGTSDGVPPSPSKRGSSELRSDGVPETPQRAVDHDPAEELEIGALLYDSGERPSPLVVKPHGGPRGRDARAFHRYTQVLTALGCSVLEVNYRGSTGRGRAFVERLYDGYGGAEQGDIATGVEHVRDAHDWIDEDRIAVFGGSYGGYAAYWQLVQFPDLYDAGVAWNGMTDLVDLYECTMPHFRTGTEAYLGTPEANPDLYAERSPITHVEHLDAPLLIVHAVNDRRVPVSQARRFRAALEDAGFESGTDGDFEYRELDAEGHSSTDRAQTRRVVELLADFLGRRLGLEPVEDDGDA